MCELALIVHLGKGKVSVASAMVNDIPSIVIEPLASTLPVGIEVPKEAERVNFPIVLSFHSLEGINVWKEQLDRVEKLLKAAANDNTNSV